MTDAQKTAEADCLPSSAEMNSGITIRRIDSFPQETGSCRSCAFSMVKGRSAEKARGFNKKRKGMLPDPFV